MNDEDYDDDNLIYIEAKPITKYTFIHFGLILAIGGLTVLTEALQELGNAVIGAEVYSENKKAFEDEARVAIDTISEGNAGDE